MRFVYETESCGRCGGSGSYSYCQMYGSTCFSCKGQKRRMTKAGAKAYAAVEAKRAELCSKAVIDLKPGDKFRDGAKAWRTVVSVSTSGGGRWLDSATGEWHDYVTVNTPKVSIGFCKPTDTVIVRPSAEQLEALVAFVRTIRKGVTVEVEAAVAADATS